MFEKYKKGEVYHIENVLIDNELYKKLHNENLVIAYHQKKSFMSYEYMIFSTYQELGVTLKVFGVFSQEQLDSFFQLKKVNKIKLDRDNQQVKIKLEWMPPKDLEGLIKK